MDRALARAGRMAAAMAAGVILAGCSETSVSVADLGGGRYQATGLGPSPSGAEGAAVAQARAQCADQGLVAQTLSQVTDFSGSGVQTEVVINSMATGTAATGGTGGSVVATAAPDAFRSDLVFTCTPG